MCRVCFKTKKSNRLSEAPEDRSALTPYSEFHKWERKHKFQCDALKNHLIKLPIVENVMIKNVINIHTKDETELVCHIVLTEDYENFDVEALEQSLLTEEQKQYIDELKERDADIRKEKWRLLDVEKELLENEKRLVEFEKLLTQREVDTAKRDRETIQALQDLCTKEQALNRNNALKQAELEAKQKELESTRLEIEQKQKELKENMSSQTKRLVDLQELQGKKMNAFEQKEKTMKEEDETMFATYTAPNQRSRRANDKKQVKLAMKRQSQYNTIALTSQNVPYLNLKDMKLKLNEPIISTISGWNVSPFEEEDVFERKIEDEDFALDYPENDIFYYRENFMLEPRVYEEIEQATKYFKLGRLLQRVEPWHFYEHVNFLVPTSSDKVIVSIRKTADDYNNFIGIFRSKISDQPFLLTDLKTKVSKAEVSTRELVVAFKKKFTNFKDDRVFAIECKKEKVDRKTPGKVSKFLPEDLLDLDRKLKVRNYKFAVIYCGSGQSDFDQILNNRNPSTRFYQFMDLMADRIKIKGWKGYKADLDVKTNTTCLHSYYTEWCGLEVMFHVAPMLEDHCRNRIIGNDVVAIIWQEEGSWNPAIITSQVLHAQIVIKPIPSDDGETFKLKVGCVVKDGVPRSRPKIPDKLWSLDDNLRDFVLKKCVNTERAAWHCHTTVRSQSRSMQEHLWTTREGQLSFLLDKHMENAKEL